MSSRLIISKVLDDKFFAFKFCNDKIQSIEYCDTNSVVGNIYVGVVAEVVKNINAAFICFDNGLKGYYSINDNTPIFLNRKNNDKLCQGDRVLVQVLSDKVKSKEYTLTSNITFTGRYVVLTVGRNGISISKKIKEAEIRQNLKESFVELNNEEYGFILRTSCVNESIQKIKEEALSLIAHWEKIKDKAIHLTVCSVVERTPGDVTKISLEACNKGTEEIITDEKDIYRELASNVDIKENCNLRFYDESFPLTKMYSLEKIISDSLNKRVWLKSGAYLVIEHTEALNVIDVNTGKAMKNSKREDNFFAINMEAAGMIATEIKKRNLSGIIIVDFINMKNEDYNKKLIEEMRRLVSLDDVTTTVAGLSNLGLMEITRKRVKKPLYELV